MTSKENELMSNFIKRTYGQAELDTILAPLPKRPNRWNQRWREGPGSFALALSGDEKMRGIAIRGEDANLGTHNTLPAWYLHEYPLNNAGGLLQRVGLGLIARAKQPFGSSRDERSTAILHNEHEVPKLLAPVVETDDTVIRRVLSSFFLDVNHMGGISKLEVSGSDFVWTERPSQKVSNGEPPLILQPVPDDNARTIDVVFEINEVRFSCAIEHIRNAAGEDHIDEASGRRKKTFIATEMKVIRNDREANFDICALNGSEFHGGVMAFDIVDGTNDVHWFMKDRETVDGEDISSSAVGIRQSEWILGYSAGPNALIIPYSSRTAIVEDCFRNGIFESYIPIDKRNARGIVGMNMLRGTANEWNAHDFGLVVVNFFGWILEYFGAHFDGNYAAPPVLQKLFFGREKFPGSDYSYPFWPEGGRGKVGPVHTVLDVAV